LITVLLLPFIPLDLEGACLLIHAPHFIDSRLSIRFLVLGKLKHSTGRKIRAKENLSGIVFRWAETDRSAAVEEELHKEYVKMHGHLPAYTKIT
jgi:hypothetical protein